MKNGQFSDINLSETENKPRTIVKRAWEVGKLTVVVIDKTLAQALQIADGTLLEQVSSEDGILLRVGRKQEK